MMKRMLVLAAMTVSLALTAGRTASAAFADFRAGTTVTPSPINPTASVPAQGSVVNQSGVGSYPSPSGAVNNAAINGPFGRGHHRRYDHRHRPGPRGVYRYLRPDGDHGRPGPQRTSIPRPSASSPSMAS